MTNEFAGKVVLVTGAGKGTGRIVAEAFAARGAAVAADDVTPVNLDETVAHITAAGGRVKAYIVDIAKKLPVQGLLNQVLDDFGRLDVLVNCAEVKPQKSALEMDEWDWVRTLDVNLTGAFLLTQSAGRIMKEKGGGIIVHIGERATISGNAQGGVHAAGDGGESNILPKRAAYFASKAGLEAMVKSAADEFAAFGVRVHLVKTADEALEACAG